MRMASQSRLIRIGAFVATTIGCGFAFAQEAGPRACASAPVQQGCGTYLWPDGSKYVGGFRGGYMDGPATIFYADGSRLDGNFLSSGGASGDVTYTSPAGEKVTGAYHDPSKDVTKPHTPVNFPFWRAFFADEAEVEVATIVDDHGNVTNAQLYRPIDSPSFTKAAIDAVSAWKYVPATVGNKPVKAPYMVQIQFATAR